MYKVVVVEDEEIARKGIIFTINWDALNCMIAGEAANGEEGAAVIRRLSPDIIVTDLKMPRMDGVEMIAKLREQGNRAKFIILTAYGDFKYAQSAVKLGVSDYLLKPLKDGDLEQAVTRIIDQLEEGDRLRQKEEEETPIFRFNADRKAKNKYVEQAIKQIREHYKEDINISTVAEQLQISEGYLSRVFKKETDYTFTTYLSYYRMKVAMELLKEGNLKVYEVAEAVGFRDQKYFVKNPTFGSAEEAITYMTKWLIEDGMAAEDFTEKVLDREKQASTAFGKIALPHSLKMMGKSTGIFVIISEKPIPWHTQYVNVVLLLCISERDRMLFYDIFDNLISLFVEEKYVQEIAKCKDYKEFENLMLEYVGGK